jgi:hypothetical protein
MVVSQETNSIWASISGAFRHNKKYLLLAVGVPSLGDLLKEYGRGKAMDWLLSKTGPFSDFLRADPFAFTQIGLVLALIVVTVKVVGQSRKEIPSTIYEHRDKPFMKPPASDNWIVGFMLLMAAFIGVVCFGGYRYWQHRKPQLLSAVAAAASIKSTSPSNSAPVASPKPPPRQPIPKRAAPTSVTALQPSP